MSVDSSLPSPGWFPVAQYLVDTKSLIYPYVRIQVPTGQRGETQELDSWTVEQCSDLWTNKLRVFFVSALCNSA